MNRKYAEDQVEGRAAVRGVVCLAPELDVHHAAAVDLGPRAPDYIPIRITPPESAHPGENFYLALEFESCPSSGAESPATVAVSFAVGGTPIPPELPQNPSAASVTVNSQHVGNLLCRLPSNAPTGTLSVTVNRAVGECVGEVFATLPLDPLE